MCRVPISRALKPIILGPRARGFIDDEADALVEALRALRDRAAS